MQNRGSSRRLERPLATCVAAGLAALFVLSPALVWATQIVTLPTGRPATVRPVADGTLVDGSIYGEFDGIPDDWDWTFDASGYEGAITLGTALPASSLEHRVVWEYNLSTVTPEPPVYATLTFTIRGAPVFPMPDTVVHVYSYPADLLEMPEDFGAEPAVLQGSVTVEPFQAPTVYTLDVSRAVNAALRSGDARIGFRFQVNPDTPHTRNQAFIDALDEEPETKPFLSIRPPGVRPKPGDEPDEPIDPAPLP